MTKRILKLSQPGDVVGNFRVIKRERSTYELSKYKNGKQGRIKRNMLLCECLLCGNTRLLQENQFKSKHFTSCGCIMKSRRNNSIIPIGSRFGNIVVVEHLPDIKDKHNHTRQCVKIKCDCGNEKDIMVRQILDGLRTCDDCYNSSALPQSYKPDVKIVCNELSFKFDTMYARVYNPITDEAFADYALRDFRIEFSREEFIKKFYLDPNYNKSKQIDRINNNAGYSLDNIRWTNQSENNLNRVTSKQTPDFDMSGRLLTSRTFNKLCNIYGYKVNDFVRIEFPLHSRADVYSLYVHNDKMEDAMNIIRRYLLVAERRSNIMTNMRVRRYFDIFDKNNVSVFNSSVYNTEYKVVKVNYSPRRVKMKTREEIERMEKMIEKYNNAYYNDSESLVSDKIYDDLVKEVVNWYKDNHIVNTGITSTIGAKLPKYTTKKVRHIRPMLSLNNTYDIGEITQALDRENITNWIAESKLDGISIALIYRNGNLMGGLTRGDGEWGSDVTTNVKAIDNIPQSIPVTDQIVEVRGEVLVPKQTFEKLNNLQSELGLETFKTSRNLASGTINGTDSYLVGVRGLKFVGYFLYGNKVEKPSQLENLQTLKQWGFEIPDYKVNISIEQAIHDLKEHKIYDVDGVVFKNNNTTQWIGRTSKFPKWAFCYKYPTKQVETKLIGVEWRVSKSGRINPIGLLEPVVISGTTVSRATLHNMSEIKRKDIRVNDYVVVEKAAEIIPQVVGPVPQKRSEFDTYPITAPSNCPECGGKVVVRDSNLYCIGPNCKSKLVETLTYFADRTNMNIQGLGRSTVEKLVDAGLLTDIASIYTLKDHRSALLGLDKLSEKSVDNLLNEIEKSRQNSFGKLLGSLGIETVGRSVGQALAAKYPTWKDLMRGVIEEFPLVKGVGHATAVAVWNFMVKQDSPDLIMNYIKGLKKVTFDDIINVDCKRIMDLHIGENDNKKPVSNRLNGKVFGFTGKLPVSRNIVVSEIESHNGQFSGTIGKKLDYLIVGLNPTAHKIKTAKDLGIKMISYEQFRKMVDVE